MKKANNSPIYATCYRQLAEIAREGNWCLAVHGSMARDMDLVLVPFNQRAVNPDRVVSDIAKWLGWKKLDPRFYSREMLIYIIQSDWRIAQKDPYFDITVYLGQWRDKKPFAQMWRDRK